MSTKRHHQSSDDEDEGLAIDVRRFIDDAAVEEDGEEEVDDDEEDPDHTQFFVDDNDGDTIDESHVTSDAHPHTRLNYAEEAAEELQQAQLIAQRYVSQREIHLPEGEFEDQPMHQAVQRNMNMYCIDVPARLADTYIEQLKSINSSVQFGGQDIIHAPFAPLHHTFRTSGASSKRRKVYFFMSKGVSYDTIRNSTIFHPGGFMSSSYVVTAKLPPSYTIVPLDEWTAFTSAVLAAGSLVRIRAAGAYNDALGYVIAASTNPTNECALIAVVPKIKYPDIHGPKKNGRYIIQPSKKRARIESRSNHPSLFDPNRLLIRKPEDESRSLSKVHTVIHDDGFQRFFQTKFPSIDVKGVEYRLDLDDFSFRVRQREVDYVTNESNSRYQAMNMETRDKIPPVYHYCGHLYYLGMRIIANFQRRSLTVNRTFQVDEVLPFVESRIAPDIFDPLISQMHWQRGDKILDLVQTDEYPFFRIHKVDLEEGVVIAHLVLSQADKEDADELRSAGVPVDTTRLPHEYNLSAFRLRLVVGDHVRVIAGTHKTMCGTIIVSVTHEGYVRIIPYGGENDQPVSVPVYWLETHSGPDVSLSTFHQQSLIRPDSYVPPVHYQGYHINDVVRIRPAPEAPLQDANHTLPSQELVGRSGRIVGIMDDGVLILELYSLNEDIPPGDDQTEQVSEVDEATENLDGLLSVEVNDRSQPQIIHVDRGCADVVLRASIRDYLQLIGVNDFKQDRGEVTDVYEEGFAQLQLSDGTAVTLPLNRLQPINPGYDGFQHPAVGKEVTVWAKKSLWRGRVGTAKSHNSIMNTFQVAFPTALLNFHAQHLWRSDGNGQYTCVDRQHGPPIKMTIATAPSTPTTRTATPPPNDTTDITSSGFDVVAGESSIREPTRIDFLAEAWATSLSRSHHFQLTFLPGHIVGSMVDRQCMTVCPSDFSFDSEHITVKYTDRKNDKHHESVLCRYLAPFSPQKCGGNVVFIEGSRSGVVCGVKKAKRAGGTLDLVTTEQELIRKQDRHICCGVEAHVESSCRCITFPDL